MVGTTTSRTTVVTLTTTLLLAGVVGCSAADGGPETTSEGLGCAPNAAISCACVNGSTGMQTCQADGTYGTCSGCGMATESAGSVELGGPTTSPTDPTTDPVPTDEPDPIEPDPIEPDPIEPDPVEPDPVEPDPVEPDPIEPDPIEPPADTGVPDGAHCSPIADWDPLWVQWEEEVLVLVNEQRALGANCGSKGSFGPAAPLTMNATLRCAARLHSLDMAERDYFDHVNPDGSDPFARMAAAGYSGGTMGENIAAGQSSPQAVVAGWMGSDGHCANIMAGSFTEIGVGYYHDPAAPTFGGGLADYWTQNFGGPGWGGF